MVLLQNGDYLAVMVVTGVFLSANYILGVHVGCMADIYTVHFDNEIIG